MVARLRRTSAASSACSFVLRYCHAARSRRRLEGRRPGVVLSLGGSLVAIAVVAGLTVAGAPAHAAFPGNNGRIACSTPIDGPAATPPGQERLEIFAINPDLLSDERRLPTDASANAPKYSPDGNRVAFTKGGHIWTMNADGTNQTRRLTFGASVNGLGSWSPDGNQIVFHSNRDPLPPNPPPGSNANEIYRMNADGSNQTRVTNNTTADDFPAWSPEGTKIAFRANRDGNRNIYTMNPDGSAPTNLTPSSPPEDSGPAWSPDGRQIAFHTDRDAFGVGRVLNRNLELYRMNADGSGVTRLTVSDFSGGGNPNLDLTGYDLFPAWSPRGDRIAFHSGRAQEFRNSGEISGSGTPYVAQWEVYTINAVDGSDIRRITNRPRNDERCDWQPVRPATVYPPVYPPVVNPPPRGKHKTSLTLNARPRRDRRPPFRFTFSGRVRIPGGVSAAAVCGGRVRLVLRKGRRTVARGTAGVSRRCTYRKRITIRGTKRSGRRRARLRVTARYGGNASLSSAPRRSTTVRIF